MRLQNRITWYTLHTVINEECTGMVNIPDDHNFTLILVFLARRRDWLYFTGKTAITNLNTVIHERTYSDHEYDKENLSL